MIELSRKKARPTKPRSSRLRPVPAALDRARNHDAKGHWQVGNDGGRDRGRRSDIIKTFGSGPLGRSARRRYRAILRQVGRSGEVVEGEAAALAICRVKEAHYHALSLDHGLETSEGRAFDELALRYGERSERRLVTLIDVVGALTGGSQRGGKRQVPQPGPTQTQLRLAEIRAGGAQTSAEPSVDSKHQPISDRPAAADVAERRVSEKKDDVK